MDKQEFLKQVAIDYIVFWENWSTAHNKYLKLQNEFHNIVDDYHISPEEKMDKLLEMNNRDREREFFRGINFYQKQLLQTYGEGHAIETTRAFKDISEEELERYADTFKKRIERSILFKDDKDWDEAS